MQLRSGNFCGLFEFPVTSPPLIYLNSIRNFFWKFFVLLRNENFSRSSRQEWKRFFDSYSYKKSILICNVTLFGKKITGEHRKKEKSNDERFLSMSNGKVDIDFKIKRFSFAFFGWAFRSVSESCQVTTRFLKHEGTSFISYCAKSRPFRKYPVRGMSTFPLTGFGRSICGN